METKRRQGELSLIEKKRNREIWRNGTLDRVKNEKRNIETRKEKGERRWREYITRRLKTEGKSLEDYKRDNFNELIKTITKDMGDEKVYRIPKL